MSNKQKGITEDLVNETINSLPQEVQAYVKTNCICHLMGDDEKYDGVTLSKEQHNKPYLIVYRKTIKSNKAPRHVVAHELAHAWLKHKSTGPQDVLHKQEQDAEKQVVAWNLYR